MTVKVKFKGDKIKVQAGEGCWFSKTTGTDTL